MTSGSIVLPDGATTVAITTPTVLTALVNYAPVASFIAAMNNLVATITDTSTDPNSASSGSDAWTHIWNFGDGSSATVSAGALGNNQTHTYNAPGAYTISLLLTDKYGLSSATNSNITAVSTPNISGGGGGSLPAAKQQILLKGDTNGDGRVDILDFNKLMVQWGMKGISLVADLNKDGVVDLLDFNRLLINWSK